MSKEPGIQRPVLDKSVHQDVHKAVRNIYDNLYHLKDRTDINATAIAGMAKTDPKAAPIEPSGVYTPVLFNEVNIDSSTAYPAQWFRVGNMVTVTGYLDVNPTAAANTEIGISVPVKTNLQFIYQLAGTAAATDVASECAGVQGDTGNNRARMKWVTVSSANHAMYYSFTYQVN